MATSEARRAQALDAYVLHRWPWSETSLIVELFTRALGRVVVVAKGAKRPSSQLRPVLLPFQRIVVALGRAPADEAAEVRVLRSAEWAGGAPLVPDAALFAAFYLNELVMKLLARQDPHPALFDRYEATLAALAGDEVAALRAFELALLRETGLLPDLSQSTQQARGVAADGRYTLDAELGLVARSEGVAGARWAAIEVALGSPDAEALRAACRPVAAALRGPLRAALQYHLGTSRLRTRDVMLEVQKLAEPR